MNHTQRLLRNLLAKVLSLALLLVVLVSAFTAVYTYTRPYAQTHVSAATSSNLNFQARLLNSSGSTVPDGYYNIDFQLYTALTGGTSVWGETYFDSNGVTAGNDNRVRVVNGYLSVSLGSQTAFPATIDWSQEHWLTMNVGGSAQTATPTWDGQMTPRLKLTAVPYAFRSAVADALTDGAGTLAASGILQKAPAAAQSFSSTVAGLRIDQTGTGGLVQLMGNGVDIFTVDKTGNTYVAGTLNIDGTSLNIGTGTQAGLLVLENGSAKTGTIQAGTLSANRTYTLPDADGTICLVTTCTGGGGGPTNAFVQDGNTFGAVATVGTNDAFALKFETTGLQRMIIDAGGNVGVGTSGSPSQLFSVGGTTGNFTVNGSGSVIAADVTSNGALSVLSGGASINGGLNNNSGGITNAGNITGIGTNLTANAALTIASGGTSDLALTSASGLLVLNATTLQAADNLALDLTKATDTALTIQNSGTGISNLNLLDGGLYTAGTQRITNGGALQNITGLSIISGGASITGNITLGGTSADRLTINAQLGGASPLVFQGATDNGFATTLGVTDPTANNTIFLPDASGTLVLDGRSITTATGSGLTGGGNLSTDRSLSLDINGITSKTAVNMDDFLAVYDSTSTTTRKISRADFLQGLIGAVIYRGTWDASTNTPTLLHTTGTEGHEYAVSVAGTQNFGSGPGITFGIGDFVIHNGTKWERVPTAASVTSVFGRTGAVTAQNGDYNGLQITNTPSGTIAATTVQAALNELATEKLGSLNGLTAITQTFANDTNLTITSSGSTHTLGWAGLLAVGRGGTGANTFTPNGVIFGNGTGAMQVTAAGTGGQVLLANATGVPTFTSLSGDISISSTGLATIGANTINLGTDTVGNYIANLGALTGLTTIGNTGEGSTPTLAVTYGSLANTSVQGNTGLTVTAGTNLSGGGAIVLGTGGTLTINTIANPTFGTSVTTPILNSTAALSISSGGSSDITLDSASGKLIIASTDTTLERTAAGSYTIDLKDSAATTLVLANSTAGPNSVTNLNLADGDLQIAGLTILGNDRTLQNLLGITNVGAFTTSGGIASFNVGSNFATNINTGTSTGTVSIGGGTAPLVINSTGLDVSAAGALSGITTINTSGLVTSVGLNAGTGLIQGIGGLTITGAAVSLNVSSNFATNINTGTSTGTVNIGGGTAPLVINSTAFDVSAAGAVSGVTTLTAQTINATTGYQINGTAGFTRTCANNQFVNAQVITNGITTATPSCVAPLLSDARLKQNIVSLDASALDKIKSVNTVNFDFNCNADAFTKYGVSCDPQRQAGVIAQELAQIFPDLVYKDDNGYYNVKYQGLSIYTLKAVAELGKSLDSKGNATLNNATVANNLTVNGVIQAGTIRADHIEGLEYNGRFDALESRVSAIEQKPKAAGSVTQQNIDLENLVAGSFTAMNQATFKEMVRFQKNAQFDGQINVLGYANVQGLTVNLDLAVRGSLEVDGPATFKEMVRFQKDAQFDGNVAVKGQVTVNSDTAGYATVKAGEASVKVKFTKPKTLKPVISLTLGDGKFAQYSYKNVTPEEFEIVLAVPSLEDLNFSWVAVTAEQPPVATKPEPNTAP